MHTISTKENHITNLSTVLTQLMQRQDIDDAKLSRHTGIPASTIARMRTNKQANPTASTLRPIASYFDITLDELLGFTPLRDVEALKLEDQLQITNATLPVVEWDQIVPWVTTETSALSEKQTNWLRTEHEVGERSFAVTVSSDSFGAAFPQGSLLLFDPQLLPKDGDLVLIQFPGSNQVALRKIIIDGEDVFIRSVNPELKETKKLTDFSYLLGVLFETRYVLATQSLDKKKMAKSFLLNKLVPLIR